MPGALPAAQASVWRKVQLQLEEQWCLRRFWEWLRRPAAKLLYAEFEIMVLQLAEEAPADGESDAVGTAVVVEAEAVGTARRKGVGRAAVIAIQFWF
jgi:hypothetical protein